MNSFLAHIESLYGKGKVGFHYTKFNGVKTYYFSINGKTYIANEKSIMNGVLNNE